MGKWILEPTSCEGSPVLPHFSPALPANNFSWSYSGEVHRGVESRCGATWNSAESLMFVYSSGLLLEVQSSLSVLFIC